MAQEPTVTAPEPVAIGVTHLPDVRRVQEAARVFAEAAGFPPAEREEIALVTTELASNLVKHARGGLVRFSTVESRERRGMQIETEDDGPGISNVDLAMTDGYSTSGSLGAGLGTVNRLMDDVEFHSRMPTGVRVITQRWIRPPARWSVKWLEFGAATRSYRNLPENGDDIVIKQWEGYALVGLIDGLGHGRHAQQAARHARQYLELHYDQPLDALFRGAGRACRATRGVVMALGRFDLARHTVSLAGIGNVEIRLHGPAHTHIPVRRGIVGLNAPQPLVTENAWTPASVLVMHSDGLDANWNWDNFKDGLFERPAALARNFLGKLGRMEDDATVMVAKNADP